MIDTSRPGMKRVSMRLACLSFAAATLAAIYAVAAVMATTMAATFSPQQIAWRPRSETGADVMHQFRGEERRARSTAPARRTWRSTSMGNAGDGGRRAAQREE